MSVLRTVIFIGFILAVSVGASTMAEEPHEALVQEKFHALQKPGNGWSARRSPLFPGTWPLDANTPLFLYQYLCADRFSPELADGVHLGFKVCGR
jgi:hypothetical protein